MKALFCDPIPGFVDWICGSSPKGVRCGFVNFFFPEECLVRPKSLSPREQQISFYFIRKFTCCHKGLWYVVLSIQ